MSAQQHDRDAPVTLDEVLSKFSISSSYHRKLGFFILLAFLSNSVYCSNYIFVAEKVDYSCKPSARHCEASGEAGGEVTAECYERVPDTADSSCVNGSGIAPCRAWLYSEPDSFVAEFQLACEEWKRTLIGSIHSFGYMVGLLVVGPVSDRIGRKPTLIATGVLGGVFGVARSFTTNYWGYVALEFLEASIGDSCSPAFMLVMEIVAAKDRARYYMIVQLGYQFGGLVLVLCAWYIPYWRFLLRVLYAPAFLFIFYAYTVDESPRWLLTKGRKQKAVAVLEKAAKSNNVALNKKMLDKIQCEQDASSENAKLTTLLKSTFKSNVLLGRFFVCVFWWTTCTFVNYGVSINSVLLSGNKYVNYALLSVVDFLSSFITAYTLVYYKRKKPLLFSFLASALFFSIQPFTPKDMLWLSVVLFMFGKLMSTMSFNITYVFTSELFPTYTRNSMHALCSSLGRVGAVLAPQTPLLIPYWPGLPSALFGLTSLLAAGLSLPVPDTADDLLPDTVRQAEAVGAVGAVRSAAGETIEAASPRTRTVAHRVARFLSRSRIVHYDVTGKQ